MVSYMPAPPCHLFVWHAMYMHRQEEENMPFRIQQAKRELVVLLMKSDNNERQI
jgi:hypothetical protein